MRCFPLFSGAATNHGCVLKERVRGVRSRHSTVLLSPRRSGSPRSFLILHSLVHQLFDAPIAQHHLHQRALRLSFLDISEGEFDGVEVETIVVGFGGMAVAPGVAARRLA